MWNSRSVALTPAILVPKDSKMTNTRHLLIGLTMLVAFYYDINATTYLLCAAHRTGRLLPVATVTAMRNYMHITSIRAVLGLNTGLDVGARVHMEVP